MEYKKLELKVGFTVFVAILMFTFGLMWLEGFKLRGERYEIHAVFPMVGGIDPGDVVNVNGVEKGEVKGVALKEKGVVVTMAIDAATRIPDDSRVVLQTQGIMGERIVTIIVGDSGSMLGDGSMIEGVYDPGISEALASMGKVMDDLQGLTKDIRRIAEVLSDSENLSRTVENLAAASEKLRVLIEQNAPGIQSGVRSFSRSAVRLDSLIVRNESKIDSLIARLDSASSDLPDLIGRMGTLSDALLAITEKLETDDSTLGALLNDRELLDRLQAAITSLDELVTDIKANPKKYLKVEIF